MNKKQAPNCCNKPMELKATTPEIENGYTDLGWGDLAIRQFHLFFQCPNCGKYLMESFKDE